MHSRSRYGAIDAQRSAGDADGDQRQPEDDGDGDDVERRDARRAQVRERVVVGGRGGSAGAAVERLARRALERRRVGADHEHRQDRARRRAHARRLAEDVGERRRVAIDEPRLAVVVVHRERAAVGEVVAVRLDGLGGEQVALQAHRRLALEQRQRVGQGEQDRVPAAIRRLEERPSVGDVGVDARIVVGAVGMGPADVEQVLVDLHGVHRRRPARQGDGDVVARSGADDQHVAGGVGREALVHRLVERVADRPELQPRGDPVDLGDDAAGVADRSRCAPCSTASTSCPAPPTRRRGRRRGQRAERRRRPRRARPSRTDGDEQSDRRDRPPHHRLGVDERRARRRRSRRAVRRRDRAGRRRGCRAGRTSGRRRHRGRPSRRRRRRRRRAARPTGAGRTCRGRRRSGRRRRCRPARRAGRSARRAWRASPERAGTASRAAPTARPQEPGADAEEAAEQHDVGEVGEVQRRWRRASGSAPTRRTASGGGENELGARSASRRLGGLPQLCVSVYDDAPRSRMLTQTATVERDAPYSRR